MNQLKHTPLNNIFAGLAGWLGGDRATEPTGYKGTFLKFIKKKTVTAVAVLFL